MIFDSILFAIESETSVSTILVWLSSHFSFSLFGFSLHFERSLIDLETSFETCAEIWVIFRVNLSFSPMFLCFFIDNSKLSEWVNRAKTKFRVMISLLVRIVWALALWWHSANHLWAISVWFGHLSRWHHAHLLLLFALDLHWSSSSAWYFHRLVSVCTG